MSFGFDPSKMDPKALMEVSRLVQQLPQEQIYRMQTLMHNMMAGHDVRKEMEEFEKSLPPGFREKLMSVTGSQTFAPQQQAPAPPFVAQRSEPMNVDEARLTILRAVAERSVTPEEALKLLFS